MKYFLDTEFIEDGKTIDLISIGIVSENGEEYYAVSSEFDLKKVRENDWLMENVVAHLPGINKWLPRNTIKFDVIQFLGEKPEIWGYYADYDWVVFCWLFGKMIDLPDGYPMYCRDLKQLCDSLGNPTLPLLGKGEHDALADARWNRKVYDFLLGKKLEK